MLRVTLYKNCCLTENYQEVFSLGKISNKSILERYLDNLAKHTFELDNIYTDFNGYFIFDYYTENFEENLYDYNYMKVIEEVEGKQNIIRYCFINRIEIRNELAYIYFNEDIWHSYSDKIKGMNKSFLSNSRIIDDYNYYNLPVNYAGNNNIQINRINPQLYFNVICELQIYNTHATGEMNERQTKIVRLGLWTRQKVGSIWQEYLRSDLTLSECEKLCNFVVACQSEKTYKIMTGPTSIESSAYFQVGNFYIVPKKYVDSLFKDQSTFINPTTVISKATKILYEFEATYNVYICDVIANKKDVVTTTVDETILNNFKRISFGTFNTQIETINNGTSINYKINALVTDTNFYLHLNTMDSNYDITDDFAYDVPFTAISGEANSQLKLSRYMKNLSNVMSISGELASMGISGGFSATQMGLSMRNLSRTKKGELRNTKQNRNLMKGILYEEENLVSKELSSLSGIGGGILSLVQNNMPLYSSTNGNFAKSIGLINSLYGICEFETIPDNENYVIESINNGGFNVFEFTNSVSLIYEDYVIHYINDNINYNVIAFSSIDVYGSFPRNIAIALNEILMNGVKIWYNENKEEDNYVSNLL